MDSKLGGMKRRQSKDAIEDPDPMMQALYQNILSLEQMLLALRTNVVNLVKAANFLSLNMNTLAANISSFCAADEALKKDTQNYVSAVGKIAGNKSECSRAKFMSQVEMKVLEPLNVNLTVLSDVKKRVLERESLRKAQQKKKLSLPFAIKRNDEKALTEEFERVTKEIFEELTALFQHRFDFIRAPYQALKIFQHNFFSQSATALEEAANITAPRPATSAEPPKAPPPKLSKSATDIIKESPSIQDSKRFREVQANMKKGIRAEWTKRSDSVKKMLLQRLDSDGKESGPGQQEEIIVAVPVDTGFNPDADKPAAGTAYLRLGRARGADAVGTRLETGRDDVTESHSAFQGASELGTIKINIKGRKKSTTSNTESTKTNSELTGPDETSMQSSTAKAGKSSSSSSGDVIVMQPPTMSTGTTQKTRKTKSGRDNGEIVMMAPPPSVVESSTGSHSGLIMMAPPPGSKPSKKEKSKMSDHIIMAPPPQSRNSDFHLTPPSASENPQPFSGEIAMLPPPTPVRSSGEIVMAPPKGWRTSSMQGRKSTNISKEMEIFPPDGGNASLSEEMFVEIATNGSSPDDNEKRKFSRGQNPKEHPDAGAEISAKSDRETVLDLEGSSLIDPLDGVLTNSETHEKISTREERESENSSPESCASERSFQDPEIVSQVLPLETSPLGKEPRKLASIQINTEAESHINSSSANEDDEDLFSDFVSSV